jgi:hypothetical protein
MFCRVRFLRGGVPDPRPIYASLSGQKSKPQVLISVKNQKIAGEHTLRRAPAFDVSKRTGFRPLSPNRRFRGCMSRRHDICRRCFIDRGSKDLLLDFLYLEHLFHLLSPQNQADANGARASRSASVPAASAHIFANSSRSLSAPYFG